MPTNMPMGQSDEGIFTELSSSHVCQVDNQPKLAMMTHNNSVWITIETEERKRERQGQERIKKV